MGSRKQARKRYKKRKKERERAIKQREARIDDLIDQGKTGEALGCVRKRAYRSQEEAELVAIHQTIVTGQTIRAYACPYCGKFHLTHQSVEEYRRRQAEYSNQKNTTKPDRDDGIPND